MLAGLIDELRSMGSTVSDDLAICIIVASFTVSDSITVTVAIKTLTKSEIN